MGAYSPAPVMTPALCAQVMEKIVMPTVRAMAERGTPFKGVLYAGLMIKDGVAKLIEYNVRFGDPGGAGADASAQVGPAPRAACRRGGPVERRLTRLARRSGALRGHGGKGLSRRLRERAPRSRGSPRPAPIRSVQIFHAGTKREGERILADGGRVLGVTARGQDIREAQSRAYAAIDQIDWPGGFYRRDIGWRALS